MQWLRSAYSQILVDWRKKEKEKKEAVHTTQSAVS